MGYKKTLNDDFKGLFMSEKLVGTIENYDYIFLQYVLHKQNSLGAKWGLRIEPLLWWVLFPIFLLYVILSFWVHPTESPIFWCYSLSYLIIAVLVQYVFAFFRRRYVRRMNFHNVGPATYELLENELVFSGTTLSCQIPFKNITKIIEENGNYYILFSKNSGFILPQKKNVTEGNFVEFMKKLQQKISTP